MALRYVATLGVFVTSLQAFGAPPVCLSAQRIDHTEIEGNTAILFYMLDRSVWRANMGKGCPLLSMQTRGFTYQPTPGSNEICANLQTITLNDTHSICAIGAITRVK
jgi:hypothetical protein